MGAVALADFVPVDPDGTQRGWGRRCPHCNVPAKIRTSREITITVREIYFTCRTPACNHSFVAQLTYVHGLSPSAIPDPRIDLPMRTIPRQQVINAIADADDARLDPAQPTLFGLGS
jgi:hypothetical protein